MGLLSLAGGALAEDSVTEQIDAGRAYYLEGDRPGAISELQFAINEIRSQINQAVAATMPDPPTGWSAEAASGEQAAAFLGGGTMMTRSYRQEGGAGRIEAQLAADNPIAQGMAAFLANPAFLSSQPGAKRVRVHHENAVLIEDCERAELNLMLGGRALLKLEGRDLSSPDLLVDMMEAWDVESLKSTLGL
ncbi:MAG: hypothetical protein ACFB6S_11365 [Geminicoccaceae bacterium]